MGCTFVYDRNSKDDEHELVALGHDRDSGELVQLSEIDAESFERTIRPLTCESRSRPQ
jgi:hypothetical protein